MNEIGSHFQPKSEETISSQLKEAADLVGEKLYSSDLDLDNMLHMTEEELRSIYPFKFQVYIEALRANRLDHSEKNESRRNRLKELLTRTKAINNLEKFLSDANVGATLGDSDYRLREHQMDVFNDLLCFFESGNLDESFKTGKRGWIKLPTGSGKTMIFSSLIHATGLRSLILVPNKNLIKQTREHLNELYPDLGVSAFYGDEKDISGDIIISTYQSLHNLDPKLKEGTGCDLVICDEAHRALTDRVVDHALDSIGNGRIIIGFTATPDFNEGKRVSKQFGELIHEMDIKEAVMSGILSGVKCVYVQTDIDISSADVGHGDYNEAELERALNVAKRNLAAVEIAKNIQFRGKGIVAFCLSVNHASNLADLACEHGIKAICIHGGLNKQEQEDILSQYEAGEFDMLCSVNMLVEGWDSPRTEVGINLRPTKSLVVAEQRAGRCLRNNEGKKFATIIDFVDCGENSSTSEAITMVDVIEGAVVLPPSVKKSLEQDSEARDNEKSLEALDIDGIRVITNADEILALHRESRPKEASKFESIEEIREILTESGWSLNMLAIGRVTDFTERRFHSGRYIGTGQKLIRKYLREIRNEPFMRSVTREVVINFFVDLYGEEAIETALNDVSGIRLSTDTVIRVLNEIVGIDKEKVPGHLFEVNHSRSRTKLELNGDQINQIIKNQYGEEYDITGEGAVRLAERVMTRPNQKLFERKIARSTIQNEILGDKTYLAQLRLCPLLSLLSLDDFRNSTFRFPNGEISGEMILEYNRVSTTEKDENEGPSANDSHYKEFMSGICELTHEIAYDYLVRLFDTNPYVPALSYEHLRIYTSQIESDFGSFNLVIGNLMVFLGITDKEGFYKWREENIRPQIVQNAVERVRNNFSRIISSNPPGHFTPLHDFIRTPYELEPGVSFDGKQILRTITGKANHNTYVGLIDGIMGEKYCREFWPLRKELMMEIIADSMSHTASSYGIFNKFISEKRWPDYQSFLQMIISPKSPWLDPDFSRRITSGPDLLSFWVGTADSKSAKPIKAIKINKDNYDRFIEWLGTPK